MTTTTSNSYLVSLFPSRDRETIEQTHVGRPSTCSCSSPTSALGTVAGRASASPPSCTYQLIRPYSCPHLRSAGCSHLIGLVSIARSAAAGLVPLVQQCLTWKHTNTSMGLRWACESTWFSCACCDRSHTCGLVRGRCITCPAPRNIEVETFGARDDSRQDKGKLAYGSRSHWQCLRSPWPLCLSR